jgi:demethylmenaquinone methyltransferase/2-methoxy-6-polyprenyl-1,4-benzoquinol methylase
MLDEQLVERFENYMERFPELYFSLSKIVKKFIPESVVKSVIVDLGVGPGLLSFEMAKQIPDAMILGVDPSKEMLKFANKKIKSENFKAVVGSSEKIPMESGKADVVVSRFTLSYWDSLEKGFKEIYRVLRPGGALVLEVLNKDFPKWKLFAIKVQMHLRSATVEVIKYHIDAYKTAHSFHEVSDFLTNIGFEIVYSEYRKNDWKFIIVAKK